MLAPGSQDAATCKKCQNRRSLIPPGDNTSFMGLNKYRTSPRKPFTVNIRMKQQSVHKKIFYCFIHKNNLLAGTLACCRGPVCAGFFGAHVILGTPPTLGLGPGLTFTLARGMAIGKVRGNICTCQKNKPRRQQSDTKKG